MSNAFTNFLGGVFGSGTNVKDYAHASRLYVDDYFKLAPKAGFLYYVKFNINNNNSVITQFTGNHGKDVGLLVKTTDLPKFKMSTETINQYNKKSIVQSKIEYQAVNMTFHDDHFNTTTGLWKAYYNYYYVDGLSNPGSHPVSYSNAGTKYNKPGTSVNESTNYGLNNGQKTPFFNSIEIYQLNRHQFTSFTLINPIITDWAHDSMDQSQSKLLENKMTVLYETVLYGTGFIKQDSPSGFATVHYDSAPSSLSVFGGGNNSILGAGGIIPGALEVLGGAGDTNPLGLLKTGIGISHLVGNLKNVTKSSILSEAQSIFTKNAPGMIVGALQGKMPDVLSGTSPQGLALATLPGESPTTASPSSLLGGIGLGQTGSAVSGLVSGIGNLGNTLKGLLPSLPSTSSALNIIKDEQMALAADVGSRIASNQAIQDTIGPQIAAAQSVGDTDTVNALYSHLDAFGYTDPAKLTEHLQSINQNIDTLTGLIATAESVETPADTLNVDATVLGVSTDNVYNVTENPDLNTVTGVVYADNSPTNTQFYT
jgi:hypothetical protein